MATYLHQLPVELMIKIADYLTPYYTDKLPVDLIIYQEEYLCKLSNPEFYDQILAPLKRYTRFPRFWWTQIIENMTKLLIFFTFINNKYQIRSIIQFGYGYIVSLGIALRFILAVQVHPELMDLHTYLAGHNLAIIDLHANEIFTIKLPAIYDRISRLVQSTEKVNNVMIGILETLNLKLSFNWKSLIELHTKINNSLFIYLIKNSIPRAVIQDDIDMFINLLQIHHFHLLTLIQASQYRYQYGTNKTMDEYLIRTVYEGVKKEKIDTSNISKFLNDDGFLLVNPKRKIDYNKLIGNTSKHKFLWIAIANKDFELFKWSQSNKFRYEYGASAKADLALLKDLITLKLPEFDDIYTEVLFNTMINDGFPLVKPLVFEYIKIHEVYNFTNIKELLFIMALKLDDLEVLEFLQTSDFRYEPSKDPLGARLILNEYEQDLSSDISTFLISDGFMVTSQQTEFLTDEYLTDNDFLDDHSVDYLTDNELLDDPVDIEYYDE